MLIICSLEISYLAGVGESEKKVLYFCNIDYTVVLSYIYMVRKSFFSVITPFTL